MSERTTHESLEDGDPRRDGDVATSPVEASDGDAHEAEAEAEAAIEIDVAVAMDELGRRRRPSAGETATATAEADADSVTAASADADADDDGDATTEGEACPQQALAGRVEALLFASDRPLTERRLAHLCGLPAAGAVGRVRDALQELDGLLRASGRSFRPRKVAGGWQLITLPAFGPLMARLHRDRQETRLSPAAMETLSIIAYRQPVLRAELEAIRGVACGEVLRSLLERRMISIVGRSEDLGRPMLYGTTRQFLEVFGLSSLDDLPVVDGLERRPAPRPTATTPAEDDTDVADVAADAAGDPGETSDEAAADGQDEAGAEDRTPRPEMAEADAADASAEADGEIAERQESDR